MSVDLIGRDRSYYWTSTGWGNVLRLAYDYGWKMRGITYTRLSQPVKKFWAYTFNDGQWVWAEDARAIADALERAMPDLKRRRWGRRRKLDEYERWFFTKEGRIAIQETLDFCRKGTFRIY